MMDELFLWQHAAISLIDVRIIRLDEAEALPGYTLPASAFVVTMRGKAQLRLDGRSYEAASGHVLHGGKGADLQMRAQEWYCAYLILYRAGEPAAFRKRWHKLSAHIDPFCAAYALRLHDWLQAAESMERLHIAWHAANGGERLAAKANFYHFVSVVYRHLAHSGALMEPPDRVRQALRYMETRYSQAISLDSLAALLGCSPRYLSKLFKRQGLDSPMRCLQQIRIHKARYLLVHTSQTLQEIAEQTGYPDGYTLSRSFKKQTGASPAAFRASGVLQDRVPHLLWNGSESAIAKQGGSLYIDRDNHYHNFNEGAYHMFKTKRASATAMILLGAALLLSACGGNAAINTGSSHAPQSVIETKQFRQAATEASTRHYTDLQGREIEIPTNPQRIVLQGNTAGDFWALGIEPVGIDRRFTASYESLGLYVEQEPAQDIGFPTNFETVLSLDPDLILLGYTMEKQLEEAEKIAPVVVFEQNLPLRERLPIMGDLLGKQAEAEQFLTEYEEKVALMWDALRADGTVKEGDTAVILMYYWNKLMYVIKNGGLYDLLYSPGGLAMTEEVQALEPNSGPYIEISEESMHDTLQGDHLFVLYPSNEDAQTEFDQLLQTALWQSLPQVQNGQIYFIDTNLNYMDPLTSTRMVEELPKVMAVQR